MSETVKRFFRTLLRVILRLILFVLTLFITTTILAGMDADTLPALIVYTLVITGFWTIVHVRGKRKRLRSVEYIEVTQAEESTAQVEAGEDKTEGPTSPKKRFSAWVRELVLMVAYVIIVFCSYHWFKSVNKFPESGATEVGTILVAFVTYSFGYLSKHWDIVVERYRLDQEKRAERERLRQQRRMAHQRVKSVSDMSPSEYESHVGQIFSQRGFGNVRVMGGTGDFGADVLCTDTGGQKVCVQCKKYSKPVGVSAVQEVIGARGFYGCQRAIVATTTGFTPAARRLAEKNGVELVIIN